MRASGPGLASIVLLIDVLKGYIACFIVPYFLYTSSDQVFIQIVSGFICVLGHIYPVFFNFRGGKGIGTMVGMLIYIFPIGLLISLMIWFVVLILTGYVSLASIIGSCFLPISVLIIIDFNPSILFYAMLFLSCFVIISHIKNIQRLLLGTENRFNKVMLFSKQKK